MFNNSKNFKKSIHGDVIGLEGGEVTPINGNVRQRGGQLKLAPAMGNIL